MATTTRYRRKRRERSHRDTFTGDRENRLSRRDEIDRHDVNRVLKAIGRQARQCHGDHDLQGLHDRLEDARWYSEELGIRVPRTL